MLKVTLHASTPSGANARNLVGRLDIGYSKLDAMADYKGIMLSAGLGEHPPIALQGYPRWSASVWDLVARMACLGLSLKEEVWPADIPNARTGAFMQNLTAIVEHWPDGSDTRRATVATAHVAMTGTRCNYRPTFDDDILGTTVGEAYRLTPKVVTPWDLFVRAYAWSATGTFKLPPRPALMVPRPHKEGDGWLVHLDTVAEPARTGCYRWMAKRAVPEATLPWLAGPCISEPRFVEFLRRAV